jgi:hypothetical protein
MTNSGEPVGLLDQDVGGWLADYGASFDNDLNAQEIAEFISLPLADRRIAYFREYMQRYFNHRFIAGQGTEHVLQLVKEHHAQGRWLDVGAGTSTLFWSLALEKATSVTCVDIVPEALKVLHDFRMTDELPRCYAEAAAVIGVGGRSLRSRALPWRYLVFDAHSPWPERLLEQYANVTAFGCFGTARNATSYPKGLAFARPFVQPGGVLIGCDWCRSLAFVRREGLDNRYMTAAFLNSAAREAGFEAITVQQYPIDGDPLYEHVVAYVLRPSVR